MSLCINKYDGSAAVDCVLNKSNRGVLPLNFDRSVVYTRRQFCLFFVYFL